MIYLYAFIPALAAIALISAAWQYIFDHFIDLRTLERHIFLGACLWFVTGWYLEAQAAMDLADLYTSCADVMQMRMDRLWSDVIQRLGV